MASNQREVYAQLLPLAQGCVLLPRAGICEVQGMSGISVWTAGPAWFLGFAESRGCQTPVVSLEAMAGADVPVRHQRSRLTVLKTLGTHLEDGLLAVITRGHPELVQLSAGVLHQREIQPGEAEVALTGVSLANREAYIPDLERIERRVSEAMGAGADAAGGTGDWEPGATLKDR